MYKDLELWHPVLRLREEGAEVTIAGTGAEEYTGKNGHPVKVDTEVDLVQTETFDALVIPGVMLRTNCGVRPACWK
jgi:protease I